jgi:hypothetical protein
MELELTVPSYIVYENLFHDAITSATEIIEEYASENSKKASEGDLAYWAAWYKANDLDQKNVRKEHIILFIIQHAENMPKHVDDFLVSQGIKSTYGTHKPSTIEGKEGI